MSKEDSVNDDDSDDKEVSSDEEDDDVDNDGSSDDEEERRTAKPPLHPDPHICTVLSDFKAQQEGDLSVQVKYFPFQILRHNV